MEDLPPDDELQPGSEAEPPPEAGPGRARSRVRIVITLVLVAALVVLAGIEGSGIIIRTNPEPLPNPTAPATARIVVVDAAGALSSMDPTGGSIVRYPAPGVIFQFPAWSPDGGQIAAIGADVGGVAVDVFAASPGANGTAPTIVYRAADRPAFYLYWAPDGRALAFLTTEPDGLALRRAPADASAPDTVLRNGAPMYWQWVDPTHLLVHSGGDAPDAFVGEVGLDGASAESNPIQAGRFRAPGLSVGGNYRAYAAPGQGGSAAVVVESLDGTSHQAVPIFGTAALAFSPRDDTLAFLAPAAAGAPAALPVGPLRAIDPASGAVRTLLGGSVIAFFWAPDGRTIAGLRLNSPTDDNITERTDALGSLVRAGAPAGQLAAAALLRVVFVDVASGSIRSERVGRVSDLFINQVLPFFDQYALSHRFWSPDSAAIVLPLDDDQGISQLTIIPADGSDAHRLAAGVLGTWSP